MKRLILVAALALCTQARDLHTQAVTGLILKHSQHPSVSYWLADLETGEDLAVKWPDSGSPIAIGSLVKPFTALAYSRAQGGAFPRLECKAPDCWKPGGHGTLGIVEALAVSCNSYFRQMAMAIPTAAFQSSIRQAGLAPPPGDPSADVMTGFASDWKVPPAALIGAYAQLLTDLRAGPVIAGLEACSRSGTGRAIGKGALAKTGTAPCAHRKRSPGDGYAMVLYPARHPQVILLVQVHGRPGSVAAQFAAPIVKTLRSGK